MDAIRETLGAPIDGSTLALFRFLFGMLNCFSALQMGRERIGYFRQAQFTFPFLLFYGLKPPTEKCLRLLSYIEAASFLALAIGIIHPLPALLAFAIFFYSFILDKSLFNNHHYLILLLLFLFSATDCTSTTIPWWHLLIFQLQLWIVYTYGALAKINRKWLFEADPVADDLQRVALSWGWPKQFMGYCGAKGIAGWVDRVRRQRGVAFFFAWSGFFIDLLIIPLMMWEVSRPYVLPIFLLFHLLNAWLLPIGVFPWLNLGSVVLFLSPETVRQWL